MRLFDELAQRFAARNSGPQFAKTPGALSDPLNERNRALQHNGGALLYLISLGVVAVATVVVFFGLGFLLLAHPNEEMIAGTRARDRGAEVERQRADLVPSPDKDAAPSTTQTASALSVSPAPPEPHYDVLPPASEGTAPSSGYRRGPRGGEPDTRCVVRPRFARAKIDRGPGHHAGRYYPRGKDRDGSASPPRSPKALGRDAATRS